MVRRTAPNHSVGGTTLVEILVVLGLGILLLGVLIFLTRDILSTTTKGIAAGDTLLEARRIMETVRTDLQNQCAQTLNPPTSTLILADQLQETGNPPFLTYRFTGFSRVGNLTDSVPESLRGSGPSPRRASLFTYVVQSPPEGGYPYSLVRQERFHPQHPAAARAQGGILTRVLSNRVAFFEIRPVEIRQGEQYLLSYQITLQLVAAAHPGGSIATNPGGLSPSGKTTIVDLFETAYPEFLMSWWRNSGYHRAWHTGIDGPTR